MYMDEVYENQRGNGFKGPSSFGVEHLMRTERANWSTVDGSYSLQKDYIEVPNK